MIAVRPAHVGDAAAIAAIYAPHVVAGTATFELDPPAADEIAARMLAAGDAYPWLVASGGDGPPHDVLGYAYAAPYHRRAAYRWAVETSVYVAQAAQGRGVGGLLYRTLIATLCAQGFTQAIGAIALPNAASVALHEALGFRRAGVLLAAGWKHQRWIDVGYWQRALAAPGTQPAPPGTVTDALRR